MKSCSCLSAASVSEGFMKITVMWTWACDEGEEEKMCHLWAVIHQHSVCLNLKSRYKKHMRTTLSVRSSQVMLCGSQAQCLNGYYKSLLFTIFNKIQKVNVNKYLKENQKKCKNVMIWSQTDRRLHLCWIRQVIFLFCIWKCCWNGNKNEDKSGNWGACRTKVTHSYKSVFQRPQSKVLWFPYWVDLFQTS